VEEEEEGVRVFRDALGVQRQTAGRAVVEAVAGTREPRTGADERKAASRRQAQEARVRTSRGRIIFRLGPGRGLLQLSTPQSSPS